MLNLMRCLLLAILLVAPIVCPTSEMFTSRRDRSSYIDTSDINPDNSQFQVDSKNRDNRSKESYIHPKNAESYTDINARIKDIFKLTEGEGTIIFDNTFTMDTGPAGANEHDDYFDMHADDPTIGKVSSSIPSTSSSFSSSSSLSSSLLSPSSSSAAVAIPSSAETFKVQRTSDGKLNVVFNEFLSLQTTTKGGSDIVYPGKWRTTTPPPQPTAEPIFHCKDVDAMQKGFCTEVEHYPEIPKIENILKREYSSFFGEDIQQPQNISQRSNAPDEIALCETKERVIYPKAAQNSESNWLYIVNEKEYRQGIKIEECIEEGVKCQYTEGLPINKRAYCKQHYNYRQLVAIQDNNTVVKDSFRMPSCCKCVVKTERAMG